jgi:hypothetical protein
MAKWITLAHVRKVSSLPVTLFSNLVTQSVGCGVCRQQTGYTLAVVGNTANAILDCLVDLFSSLLVQNQ